ncbi:putative glycosyltransferase [Actinoplanes missouriensis 431]|uniref:Putative glycosyltransferase n=1 Tax=Actinoplanes missouriensis (strain ATCC 14538 / DSM 43046 / CBS 188.64 / JCM 3121 / NBRC 102363 / NCIMB 12654 / NRRL B-3342 / UNCC 431) TaxID=512565 RepID=I0HDZ2_ACTM4|nr:putative glycosyltransferase [Actinoplanes missouriensis 431]
MVHVSSWIRRRDHNLFVNAFVLLVCGLIAGVVVAAALFPYAAMSGLTLRAGEEAFASLPSELKAFKSPQITRVYASDNKTPITQFYDEFRSDVPLKDISPHMRAAMVAAEDREFYKHNGVDIKGVARALVNNNQGGPKQGASTITMQWVRMSLAYSATSPKDVVEATKDTPKRKLTEMKYALELEKQLSKDQILERYLNIVPFGKQTYGVFAASRVYFNKSPKDLTIGEAAMLAGIVRAPSGYDPTTSDGHEEIRQRRNNYVIPGMVEMGAITAAQANEAIKTSIPKKVRPISNGCVSVAKNNWGFFCDYFYRWWMDRQEFGPTAYDRERRLKSGGYRITTTLDVTAQKQARARISDLISEKNKNALLLAAVQPGTGKVRLLAANRRYKLDDPADPQNKISSDPRKARQGIRGSYPNTTNPLLTGGGDITGYQAGSVMKIFTLVAALEKNYPLAYTIKAEKRYKSKYIIDSGNDAACEGTHYWCPSNSGGGGEGVYNMWSGFGRSINTYFVPLEERVGAENVVAVAKRFGIQFRAASDATLAQPGNAHQWGAFTLGVSATTPLDMANAYATLAADGMYCPPTPIEGIVTRDGAKLDVGRSHCIRATDVDVARAAVDAARCPVGDSARLGSCEGSTAGDTRRVVGHPVFGKTGTTDRDKTASLIAGTTSLVVAGYLVNPDYQNHRDRLRHEQVNPAVYRTLGDYMDDKPRVQFKRPENRKIAYGDRRSIPDVECDPLGRASNRLERAGFTVDIGREVDSNCPAGTAAGTDPSGRTVKNGVVTIEVSNGKSTDPPVIPGVPPSTPPTPPQNPPR